ncbi:nonstructural protein NSS [Rio Grande virus]|uniref:NSs n=1 Tax=Rio Grande virus TaxID=629740 RepID=A0A4P8D7W4_9VIRU|nr:nonstructural protein NSS [Rio Grande virus]QCI62756.1 NSs [Rio Grande virus]QEI46452.1 nonstructural protein NSS [Rio Grande virus]QKN22592.1 NSs protein [Rio Grande virus]
MENYYIHDMPFVRRTGGRASVHFRASLSYIEWPVANYYGMEFPIKHYQVDLVSRARFNEFFDRGFLPLRISSEADSQVPVSPPEPEGIFEFLACQTEESISSANEEYMLEAISWPLGRPSLGFFRHYYNRGTRRSWIQRSMLASDLLNASGYDCLCCAFPKVYSNVLSIAQRMDLDLNLFTGNDIVKEICHIQCVKMMKAALMERSMGTQLSPSTELILTAMGEATGDRDPIMEELLKETAALPSPPPTP